MRPPGSVLRASHLWGQPGEPSSADAELEGAQMGRLYAGRRDRAATLRGGFRLQGSEATAHRGRHVRHGRASSSTARWRPAASWPWGKLPRLPLRRLRMYLLRFLYGYGERPERVIALGGRHHLRVGARPLALRHRQRRLPGRSLLQRCVLHRAGLRRVGAEPQGWAGRFLGVGEALMGVFMMALFLVTFTRKMTR